MDSASPFSRVERTLWSVWYYITGAVNRFLRPEPTDTVNNDPNSFQESTVDSEPPDAGHPESDTSREVVNEEQAVTTASLLSSSKPVVAWEVCTTEINLGPEEESMQYKSLLSGGSESKASEEGEGTREEQISQTGNDDAGLLIANDARAKEDEQEENRDRKLFAHKQDETTEINEYEDRAKSLNLTDDAMSEDMDGGGRRSDAEEETQVAVRLDDLQKIEETVGKIQVMEEDDEMHHEDEEDLELEDTEIKLSPMTDFSFEEERNVHTEDACVQRDEADTSVTYEEVENSEDVLELGEKQVKNQFSVCEEPLENVEDVKQDTGLLLLNDDLQMTFEKSGNVSEDVEQEHLMVRRSESDKVEDEREEEEENSSDEREQGAEENVNVSADSQSIYEEPEQEEDIKTVAEDSQEEDILTERVSCHEEVMQNAEAESTQHTAEFTDEEKEDVAKDAKVQTKIRETDNVDGTVTDEKSRVTTTDISVDERFFDKDQVEEERLSSEEKDRDVYMEIACTTTSVTGVPEGETGQEISGEFENIPPGICEGPLVVSQELNSPTCEETQEGVPEYNNEPGPDENITQKFLEVGEGDCEEIHAAQLPEEEESEEPESLQNTGGDYLLVSEHMEEELQSTEDITDEHTEILNLTQETEKPVVEPVTEGSGPLFEEEEGKSLDSSVKMGIKHSEKEFETHIGVTDKTNETTKELQDETEELLVEFEIDEGLSDFRDAVRDGHEIGAIAADDLLVEFADKTIKTFEVEEQEMTEMTFQESVDAKNSEQKTSSLLEDITESGFMRQLVETEPKLFEDGTVEMEDAGIDMEETGYGVEDEAIEDEMQNENEMEILNLEPAGLATDPTTENINNTLLEESELSRPDESVETRLQLSDEAFKIRNEEMLADTEVSAELMTTESEIKDMTLILTEAMEKHGTESERNYAEEASSSVTGCQDVIDEEILDLWIETALSKDTNDMEQQEGSQPEQKTDTKIEPSTDEQDEMPSVHAGTEKEQLAESNSGESGLVSDTEMSSSAAESGFLDQSVSEWGTGSENQLLKSLSTGSFQGTYDIFASISESLDISELSTQKHISETQDILIEEAVEIEQSDLTEEESIIETGFHPDSGVVSSEAEHLSQELDLLQEKTDGERVESAESETGSQKELDADITDIVRITDWKDDEEANEVTAPDCPSEIKHAESRSGTEASLQEKIMSAGSEDNTCAEPEKLLRLPSLDKPQPRWLEDIAESLLELDGAEVAEQLTTTSEDQIELDRSALDFTAQRSRIAVKNPRVRPPKDPRSLLHMPSVEPTPSSHLPVRVPAGVPLGGMGIGIKLPGLGAGFPVLKKTRPVVKGETSSETPSQEPETKPEEKSGTPREDEVQHKPKWMPPRQPGFGNPLMSELKSKLKKPTQE